MNYNDFCKERNLLEISDGNGKTGPSVSLPAGQGATCQATSEGCGSCYAQIGRMGIHQRQGSRYWRNYSRAIQALKVSKCSSMIIDSIRMYEDFHSTSLKTLRLHDSGDFFSPSYVDAWTLALRELEIKTWWYTRSWKIDKMIPALRQLCEVSSGWISCDRSIYDEALTCFIENADRFKGMAYQQIGDIESERKNIFGINKVANRSRSVIFPTHLEFGRVPIAPYQGSTACPAIIDKQSFKQSPLPACLQCRKCI